MVKLLLGIWTPDEGNIVRFKSPNLTNKEANQLLENVLFSTNIYGKRTNQNRQDVAFTLPIMYLPTPYTHGRIYFTFRFMDLISHTSVDDPLKFDFSRDHKIEAIPISVFVSIPNLNEAFYTQKIDELIWEYLHSDLSEIGFNFLYHRLITNHLTM